MKETLLKLAIVVGGFLVVLAIALSASALVGWLFMLAWNYVAHGVLGAPGLSFWQAWVGMFLLGLIGRTFRAVVNTRPRHA